MSNSKNYNSIVFLTTLSVYLGLVLIGAPPVLAQAATTRNFSVQDEIEVKDDLDKKPDEANSENFSAKEFPALFVQLFNQIGNEAKGGKFALPLDNNFHIESQFRFPGTFIGSSRWASLNDEKLGRFLSLAIDRKFVSKLNNIGGSGGDRYSDYGNVQIESNKDYLSLKISFTNPNAGVFAETLNQEFSSMANSVVDVLIKQAYLNARATSENNQVFIITRLPRGSLDALLA